MNTFKFIPILLCFIPLLFGCKKGKLDYLPVKIDKDSRWGLLAANGKLLFDDEFEYGPSFAFDGVFSVPENGTFSLYTVESKPKIIPVAEDLVSVGIYLEGLIPISKKNERIKVIDKKGNVKFTLEPLNNHEITHIGAGFFQEYTYIITDNDKCGIIDTKGNVIIYPKYDDIRITDGVFIARTKTSSIKDDMKIECIDKKNEVIFTLKSTEKPQWGYFTFGKFIVERDDILGYYDKAGNFTKLPSKFNLYFPVSGKYSIISTKDEKFGIVDNENNVVIRSKYDEIIALYNEKFLVKDGDNLWRLIDLNDNCFREYEDSEYVTSFSKDVSDFGFILKNGDYYIVYNHNGDELSKTYFSNVITDYLHPSYGVKSDYFDLNGAVNKLLSFINKSGVKNAIIGDPIYHLFSEMPSEENIGVKQAPIEGIRGGIKFDLDAEAFTNGEMVIFDDNTPQWEQKIGLGYYWNEQAKIDNIRLTMTTEDNVYVRAREAIKTQMNKKGFKLLENHSMYLLFNKDDLNVAIGHGDKSNTLDCWIFNPANTPSDKYINRLINNHSKFM